MKILTCFSILFVVVHASLLEEADVQFSAFKIKYGKSYANKAEEAKRFAIFKENLKTIDEHNILYEQGETTWQKGVTKFTDWTDEEYKSMLTLQQSNLHVMTRAEKAETFSGLTVPESMDWREKGIVTPVRDQGACAASWAFSLAGSIEGAYNLKTGDLVELSKQQLLDCSSEVGNHGCKGGYMRETLPYVEWHGIQSEASYSYQGKDQTCQYNESAVVTKIDSFKYFFDNQYALEVAVGNTGPVSTSLDASELKDYKSGIYYSTSCDSEKTNLAVLVVGYGFENDTNYWIVKNCYGSDWGEDGYFRILRKANDMACGLFHAFVWPFIY